ncbi:hypothetical protein LCGC14_0165150 [marine sediment metagenome]|uniref:Uncharacterized protein n=1 Tax=marine sediment metagenome TaxID=412755 RepID=A0A0F9XD06_9ZZZZ
MPETAPVVEMHGEWMRKAWSKGVEWYQPWAVRLKFQEEGGVTCVSAENLQVLVEHVGPCDRVHIGPNQGVLVEWDCSVAFLATGFSIGYMGEGPTGFAKFLESQDVGDWGEIRHILSALSPTFEGLLYDRQGEGFINKHLD